MDFVINSDLHGTFLAICLFVFGYCSGYYTNCNYILPVFSTLVLSYIYYCFSNEGIDFSFQERIFSIESILNTIKEISNENRERFYFGISLEKRSNTMKVRYDEY